jgi:Flp pilus assembly protein TadG
MSPCPLKQVDMRESSMAVITEQRPTARRTTTLLGLMRRGRRDSSGATVVEFALVLPAFLAMLFSIFEIGMLFFKQMLLDNALQTASRTVLTGATQSGMTAANAAQVESDFRTAICNGSFFYRTSCSDVKIQVLVGLPEINANRNFRAPIVGNTSPPTITINAAHRFSDIQTAATSGGSGADVVIRVYAPVKTLIAKISGIGLTMQNGDTVLISATAFRVEPYMP